MKPRTTVKDLHDALAELEAMAKADGAMHPEFRRGYLHAVGMVLRWCRGERGTPVPESRVSWLQPQDRLDMMLKTVLGIREAVRKVIN